MNKKYYSFGNPFKVKFRKHYCYKCNTKLSIVKHHKVVNQKSDEAKYYDFSADVDGGIMMGSCEFIHEVFYCPKCSQNIEFITQTNQEDIDILIKDIQKYFYKKGRNINIKKCFKNTNDEVVKDYTMEPISYLCLVIEQNDMDTLVYRISIARKKSWGRPYYFNVNKRDLINFINNKGRERDA